MNFHLTDEQTMFADAASRYIRERCSIEDKRRSTHNEAGYSTVHWQQFADMGWLALTLPERVDGLGGTISDLMVLMEQLGHGAFHEPIVDTAVLAASLLSDANNTSADALLARIGSGDAIVALAHTDGEGRCEASTAIPAHITTLATQTTDGWQLSGQKQRVIHAPQSSHLLVTAMIDQELGLFCVNTTSEAISQQRYALIDGSQASDLSFEQLTLNKDALLLRGEAAITALQTGFDKATMAECARAIGSMEFCMAITADYLKTRVQYGKPLAQFQALQHRMAEMFVELEQSQAILYRALSRFDDSEQRRPAVSAAKLLISKAARWVTGQCIQLHGGIGVTDEYAVGHHYKAMLTFEQRYGDSDWHLDVCAAALDEH